MYGESIKTCQNASNSNMTIQCACCHSQAAAGSHILQFLPFKKCLMVAKCIYIDRQRYICLKAPNKKSDADQVWSKYIKEDPMIRGFLVQRTREQMKACLSS